MIIFNNSKELNEYTEIDLPSLSMCEKTFLCLCEFDSKTNNQKAVMYFDNWNILYNWYIKNEEMFKDSYFSIKKEGIIA